MAIRNVKAAQSPHDLYPLARASLPTRTPKPMATIIPKTPAHPFMYLSLSCGTLYYDDIFYLFPSHNASAEPYPSAAAKSTTLARATGSNQTPGQRGCGRQAGTCTGWSLASEPSTGNHVVPRQCFTWKLWYDGR
jgi:hypothetical protein